MGHLRVTLLGGFSLAVGESDVIQLESSRLRSLLAYLLLHRQTPQPRQHLAFLLWPDSTEAQARTNLRKALFQLRRQWPEVESCLELGSRVVHWRPDVQLALDVAAFEEALAGAKAAHLAPEKRACLKRAIAVYTGPLVPDLYDEWLILARERLERRFLEALTELSQLLEDERDYAGAIQLTEQVLRHDPLDETVYRRLMQRLALDGNPAGALSAYHQCATRLQEELGVEPGPSTEALYQRLLDRKTAPVPATPGRTPLLGRAREWQALLGSWQRTTSRGRPGLTLVIGEAGLGKTRLAEELVQWVERQGFVVLPTACYATAGQLPYAPIAGWLRAENLAASLARLDPRWLTEIARLLPELLAQRQDVVPPGPMSETWQQRHFYTALAQAILAAGTPLLLFIDDLQWCDAESLACLDFLLRYAADAGLLLLGTIRQEDLLPDQPLNNWRQGWQRTGALVEIPLAPLDVGTVADLAALVLGRQLGSDEAAELMADTEGNPLFVVETARALAGTNGRLAAAQPAPMPARIRAVLEMRLAQLSRPARQLLGQAALIGPTFSFDLLAAASDLEEKALVGAVDELWQRRLVRELGRDRYRFHHDKIRQVAADGLSPGRRRQLRGRLIDALKSLHGADLDPVHARLATLYEASGQLSAAVHHYRAAARVSEQVYAHRETVSYLRRALDLGRDDRVIRPAERAELNERLGDALVLTGDREAARQAFAAALDPGIDTVTQARLWRKVGTTWLPAHAYDQASDAFARALDALGPPPAEADDVWWEAWLDAQLALIDLHYFLAQLPELDALCAQIREPMLTYGLARQKANYFTALIMASNRRSRFVNTPEVVADAQEAMTWARQTGDANLITRKRFSLGFTYLWEGRLTDAIAALREAAAESHETGNRPLENQCLAYLTVAFRLNGDLPAARASLEEAGAIAKAEGNPFYVGIAMANAAWLSGREGDRPAAARQARAALAQWADLAFPFRWLAAWPLLAAQVAQGALDAVPATARLMLAPNQQPAPDPVAAALTALQGETPDPATCSRALALAREANLL